VCELWHREQFGVHPLDLDLYDLAGVIGVRGEVEFIDEEAPDRAAIGGATDAPTLSSPRLRLRRCFPDRDAGLPTVGLTSRHDARRVSV
jgi:hypothetical protein